MAVLHPEGGSWACMGQDGCSRHSDSEQKHRGKNLEGVFGGCDLLR